MCMRVFVVSHIRVSHIRWHILCAFIRWRAGKLIVDKCMFMKSKKVPLWLCFKNADPDAEDILLILKSGAHAAMGWDGFFPSVFTSLLLRNAWE